MGRPPRAQGTPSPSPTPGVGKKNTGRPSPTHVPVSAQHCPSPTPSPLVDASPGPIWGPCHRVAAPRPGPSPRRQPGGRWPGRAGVSRQRPQCGFNVKQQSQKRSWGFLLTFSISFKQGNGHPPLPACCPVRQAGCQPASQPKQPAYLQIQPTCLVHLPIRPSLPCFHAALTGVIGGG